MKIKYLDGADSVSYAYYDSIPINMVSKGRFNIKALSLYGFYRESIYNSYIEKNDLAEDIKTRKKEFIEKADSPLRNGLYNSPLYHYSIAASLGAMKEWNDPVLEMRTFIAEEGKRRIGFIHFHEKVINAHPVIYIAQAGVRVRGMGIGRHLMECVLSHYPAGTEFYIVTRVFNSEAKNLYEKRLGFTPIQDEEVRSVGYDSRYCGFKHKTTIEEVEAIRYRQQYLDLPVDSDESKIDRPVSLF